MSERTSLTVDAASGPSATRTTRKTAARESGASTLCGSIGTRCQGWSPVLFAMGELCRNLVRDGREDTA